MSLIEQEHRSHSELIVIADNLKEWKDEPAKLESAIRFLYFHIMYSQVQQETKAYVIKKIKAFEDSSNEDVEMAVSRVLSDVWERVPLYSFYPLQPATEKRFTFRERTRDEYHRAQDNILYRFSDDVKIALIALYDATTQNKNLTVKGLFQNILKHNVYFKDSKEVMECLELLRVLINSQEYAPVVHISSNKVLMTSEVAKIFSEHIHILRATIIPETLVTVEDRELLERLKRQYRELVQHLDHHWEAYQAAGLPLHEEYGDPHNTLETVQMFVDMRQYNEKRLQRNDMMPWLANDGSLGVMSYHEFESMDDYSISHYNLPWYAQDNILFSYFGELIRGNSTDIAVVYKNVTRISLTGLNNKLESLPLQLQKSINIEITLHDLVAHFQIKIDSERIVNFDVVYAKPTKEKINPRRNRAETIIAPQLYGMHVSSYSAQGRTSVFVPFDQSGSKIALEHQHLGDHTVKYSVDGEMVHIHYSGEDWSDHIAVPLRIDQLQAICSEAIAVTASMIPSEDSIETIQAQHENIQREDLYFYFLRRLLDSAKEKGVVFDFDSMLSLVAQAEHEAIFQHHKVFDNLVKPLSLYQQQYLRECIACLMNPNTLTMEWTQLIRKMRRISIDNELGIPDAVFKQLLKIFKDTE